MTAKCKVVADVRD